MKTLVLKNFVVVETKSYIANVNRIDIITDSGHHWFAFSKEPISLEEAAEDYDGSQQLDWQHE